MPLKVRSIIEIDKVKSFDFPVIEIKDVPLNSASNKIQTCIICTKDNSFKKEPDCAQCIEFQKYEKNLFINIFSYLFLISSPKELSELSYQYLNNFLLLACDLQHYFSDISHIINADDEFFEHLLKVEQPKFKRILKYESLKKICDQLEKDDRESIPENLLNQFKEVSISILEKKYTAFANKPTNFGNLFFFENLVFQFFVNSRLTFYR